MSSNVLQGLAALPIWAKAPLVSAGLVVLGPSHELRSPVTILALPGLIVAGSGGRRHA